MNNPKLMIQKMGLPRLIILAFLLLLTVTAVFQRQDLATLTSDVLVRFGMNLVMSLAMVPAVLSGTAERCFVIGGGSVYRQMLPFCDAAYVTKVHVTPESDTFFPNLDEDKDWYLSETLQSGEENGIAYEMCLYRRK